MEKADINVVMRKKAISKYGHFSSSGNSRFKPFYLENCKSSYIISTYLKTRILSDTVNYT